VSKAQKGSRTKKRTKVERRGASIVEQRRLETRAPKPAKGLICIGHSHMACVLRAADQAGVQLAPIIFKHVHYFEGVSHELVVAGRRGFDQALVARLKGGPVFSFIGGTRYLSLGIREHPVPFDFVLRDEPDLPIEPGVQIIPLEAMHQVLYEGSMRNLTLLERVAEAATGPVYHFEPPPPPKDPLVAAGTVRGRTETRAEFVGVQRWLRYKLWRLHSEIVRTHAEEHGVVFVDRPDGTVDEEGFLRPELILNSTHANADYGRFVVEQMRGLARPAGV
jgi:hypothetical protein